MSTWFSIITRRKPIPSPQNQNTLEQNDAENSNKLARILNTFDLTALGVGSTLGVGVYVLAGHVAKDEAGPAVILSFLIAAIASVFAGLCYAEFGARVPKAGSAYIYSYVCVGEFIAFIIGWNLILEYVIGSASVAKGLSIYLDTLINNTMRNAFIDVAPINSPFLSEYFDFFSLAITLVLAAALAFGLKESSLANNIFTSINILVVLFVIIAGGLKANPDNWSIKNETIPSEYNGGKGGFFPFGIEGVIKGAATCFYGFIGFDCIATTGEEVKNPQRAIPISIILSLFIVFLSYFGTSAVVTLMVPYYLQDPDAPIPHAFDVIGWHWAKWIVSIGGIFGLCASLFGAMFPLPRIIYAMANDALVFRFLGTINQRFRTPVIGTIFAAILTGLMSALFNLKQLVNMMSIGTLMAYTIVAACVIILRYTVNDEKMSEWKYSLLQHSDNEDEYSDFGQTYETTEEYSENLNLIPPRPNATTGAILKMMFDFSSRNPDYLTQKLVTILVFIFCVLSLILACLVSYLQTDLENGELYAVIPTIITALFMLVVIMAIWAQPTVHATLSFKVPLVPLIPALSICINLYLMLMLDGNTWIRFGIWMAIGLPIYLTSCKLYSNIKTNTIKSNGHINNGYVPDNTQNGTKNGIVLTIPQIIVSTAITDEKNEVNFESETDEKYLRERTLSIDSEDFTNAVLEIDKVLYESENEFVDNFEAVNPENELKNTKILTKSAKQSDNISISSSNSGSNDSKEHHIEVQVHQEDSDEADNDKILPNLELDKNFIPETTEENSITKDSKQTTVHENKDAKNDEIHIVQSDDETEDHITNNNKTIENAAKHNNSVISEDTETNPEDNGSLVKESLKTSTPEHNLEKEDIVTEDGIIQVINLTTEALQQNSKSDNTSVQETNEDMNKNHIETNVAIPPPPPLQDLLNDSPYNIKLSINRPVLNIKEVQLRPTSVPIRTRSKSTSSTKSEGPSDNVKTGSTQYNKLKSKLNSIFQDRIILPTANIKYLDERTPSPSVEKELEINNQILEQYEVPDIPENFGKSKEFKNELNNLLLRRHSSNLKTKPKQEYIEKQNKNNDNSSRTDETKHRKLMASSLKSIRLKKTGILDTEETDQENYDDEEIKEDKESETTDKEKRQNMTEKDKETHKRLMIATLRNIKLRKTGLNLNEESADPNDISLDR